MNNGSSASISCGGQSLEAFAISSCHHRSRPDSIDTSSPVRFTTNTCSIEGVSFTALSALTFIGMFNFLPRTPVSCVISALQAESLILSRRESDENAPKTIEWTAPIRAQANIATVSSGIICM